MKNILTIIISYLSFTLTGCSSVGNYFSDRGRDALDIITITIGEGGGFNARASVVDIGQFLGGDEVGLRSGNILAGNSEGLDLNTFINVLDRFDPALSDVYNYHELSTFNHVDFEEHDPRGKNYVAAGKHFPFYSLPEDDSEYYTQIEVAAGLFVYLRLGLNPGEALDFILGWTTVDIYGDDQMKTKQSNQALEFTPDGATHR